MERDVVGIRAESPGSVARVDDQIAGWLSSARYATRAAESRAEFAQLDDAVGSGDVAVRLAAVRRLSALARAELGWFLLPVREYFLSTETRRMLGAALSVETDVKVRDSLLNTVRHASERCVTHTMWEPVRAAEDEREWCDWVHLIAATFSVAPDLSTRAEAAYLLAFCDDARAWEVYQEVIPRRSGLLPMLEMAIERYPLSISDETGAALLALADAVGSAHPRQRYPAAGIRTVLIARLT